MKADFSVVPGTLIDQIMLQSRYCFHERGLQLNFVRIFSLVFDESEQWTTKYDHDLGYFNETDTYMQLTAARWKLRNVRPVYTVSGTGNALRMIPSI
jgi:hypothetical protein